MPRYPKWVDTDLRRQALEARLRAASETVPNHTFMASPTAGNSCYTCGMAEVMPVHDLGNFDVSTRDSTIPSPEAVDPLQISADTTDDEEHPGMMLALFPDPAQAARLAVKGGEKPSNLHVTLAYFPEADPADFAKLQDILRGLAHTLPPLTGEISGMGVFSSAAHDGRVTYASIDLPLLPAFRQKLVEACARAGFNASGDHGYSPHMTLAMGDERKIDPANEKLAFDEVVLAKGKKRVAFKLGGAAEAASGPALIGFVAASDDSPVKGKDKKFPQHAYSHTHFLNGSGVNDANTPPCQVCGKGPKDSNHTQPPIPSAEAFPICAAADASDAKKIIAGIDAGVDQALVLLRSCKDLQEYAAQARDVLQGIDPAIDELMEFFEVPDPDSIPTADKTDVPSPVHIPAEQGATVSSMEHIVALPTTQRVIVVRECSKDYSQAERDEMAKNGQALPNGTFPIKDGGDLEDAIHLVGHGGQAAKDHIIKRAKDLGLESKLPDAWGTSTEKAFISEVNGRTLITAPASTLVQTWEKAATPNKHLMWMQGRFVGAEKANRNNALWTTDDLEMGQPTVAHGPLNWLHEAKHVIGCIADSKLTVPAAYEKAAYNAQPHIDALAAVWTWIYPDEAWVIENASDQQRLWYSMECISENVECVGEGSCGEKASYGDYMGGRGCQHMRQRSAVRRFENPTFLGGAVIVPPVRPGWADANANIIRQAAAMSEKAFEDAGRPDVPASVWEQMMTQVVASAQD